MSQLVPVGLENRPITVTLLPASGKGECREQAMALKRSGSAISTKSKLMLGNQTVCQTGRPLNYENRQENVVHQHNVATISEANVRFLN